MCRELSVRGPRAHPAIIHILRAPGRAATYEAGLERPCGARERRERAGSRRPARGRVFSHTDHDSRRPRTAGRAPRPATRRSRTLSGATHDCSLDVYSRRAHARYRVLPVAPPRRISCFFPCTTSACAAAACGTAHGAGGWSGSREVDRPTQTQNGRRTETRGLNTHNCSPRSFEPEHELRLREPFVPLRA